MIGLFRQSHQDRERCAVEKQGAVLDGRINGYDESMGPFLAHHLRSIERHQGEFATEASFLFLPIGDRPLRFATFSYGHWRSLVRFGERFLGSRGIDDWHLLLQQGLGRLRVFWHDKAEPN